MGTLAYIIIGILGAAILLLFWIVAILKGNLNELFNNHQIYKARSEEYADLLTQSIQSKEDIIAELNEVAAANKQRVEAAKDMIAELNISKAEKVELLRCL